MRLEELELEELRAEEVREFVQIYADRRESNSDGCFKVSRITSLRSQCAASFASQSFTGIGIKELQTVFFEKSSTSCVPNL